MFTPQLQLLIAFSTATPIRTRLSFTALPKVPTKLKVQEARISSDLLYLSYPLAPLLDRNLASDLVQITRSRQP